MHQKIHVSVSLDPETDRALEARAKTEGVTKSELIVEYIAEGLCLPDAVPSGGWQDVTPAIAPIGADPKIHRTIYLDFSLLGTLSGRAESEGMSKNRLADRFCREGLARSPSDGRIASRAKERLISGYKARIEHFKEIADKAAKTLVEEIAKFQKSCPHLRLTGDPASPSCDDCGAPMTRP